jgi:hypothetical protein
MSPLSEPHDVAATSLAYVLGLAAWALLSLGGVVIAASIMHDNPNVGAGFVTIAVLLGGLSMSAWGIYKTCYRVEVTDGYLVMRYLYRRRSVRLEEVQCIEYIAQDEDTPAKFDVLLRDGMHNWRPRTSRSVARLGSETSHRGSTSANRSSATCSTKRGDEAC